MLLSFTVTVKSTGWFLSFYEHFKFCKDAEGKDVMVNENRMLIVSKCWFAHEVEFLFSWSSHVNSNGQGLQRHQLRS